MQPSSAFAYAFKPSDLHSLSQSPPGRDQIMQVGGGECHHHEKHGTHGRHVWDWPTLITCHDLDHVSAIIGVPSLDLLSHMQQMEGTLSCRNLPSYSSLNCSLSFGRG
eukprot:1159130-Pelagomonas_calceolata.AAC.12